MGKRTVTVNDRARQMLAQEAARIIVEQGIQDYRVAKMKAAERLGLKGRGSLPGNSEIESAVAEHLKLFGRESHFDLLQTLRCAALSVMEILSPFSPRLVGPVLNGTAAANSSVNLHVFSDTPELIALTLDECRMQYAALEFRKRKKQSLAEMALKLGYSEHSTFSRAFQRWSGMAPHEYRRAVAVH